MKVSRECLKKIKEFEGFQAKAYKCPAGVWTIGYGHTKGVKSGQVITEKQAETLLEGDILFYEKNVEGLGIKLSQCKFDALVDFAFNLGTEALRKSTLLQKIRAGASESEIKHEFMRWVHAGGKVLPGLQKRRMWEAQRFFGEV